MKKFLSFLIIILLTIITYCYVKYDNDNLVAIIGAMNCEISELTSSLKNLHVQKYSDYYIIKIGSVSLKLSKSSFDEIDIAPPKKLRDIEL